MKEMETRVFVVDDDQSVRTSLARLLATGGLRGRDLRQRCRSI